tara:strand:- start:6941 stop:7858 length:918 start_codon:yes stop_codon:yes gene_type:complete
MQEDLTRETPAALGLQHSKVRDLAWACFTPPMIKVEQAGINTACFPLTAARLAWLQALDREPSSLMHWLSARPATRLGLYFERLWQFFLQQDSETKLIAHNVPVRDAGTTLGEFDCLYWCRRRERPVHLELAVKFYLGCQAPCVDAHHRPAHIWLGPNTIDRLDRKLQRLTQHQIQLSRQPAAQPVLEALHATEPLQEILLSGQLFAPVAATPPRPAGYNRALPLGQWLPLRQWQATGSGDWMIIPRLDWLAPVRAASTGHSVQQLAEQLERRFGTAGRPQLLAALDENGNERSRCFVAPDTWPN